MFCAIVTLECAVLRCVRLLRHCALSCLVFGVYVSAHCLAVYSVVTRVRTVLRIIVTLVRAVLCWV